MNPFVQRGQIKDPHYFTGRWNELSLLFHALETRRAAFILGSPGVGKSSLIKHITQSAGLNLERFDLRTFFLDLAPAQSEAEIYRVVVQALGKSGATLAALETALRQTDGPVLLCFDNGDALVGQAWGETMLDDLVRLVRLGQLMLVVGQNSAPPILSERVVVVRLGAFAAAEIRLVTDAYLESTGVSFTPRNLRQLYQLSQGHPDYLQRAAYHLFEAKLDPAYEWIQRYRDDVTAQPVPGASLPPAVFEGAESGIGIFSGDDDAAPATEPMPRFEVESTGAWVVILPLLLAAICFVATQNIWLALGAVVLGLAALLVVRQRRRSLK